MVPPGPFLMWGLDLAQRVPGGDTLTCAGSHQHIHAVEDISRVVQDQPQHQVLRLQLIKTGPKQRDKEWVCGARCLFGHQLSLQTLG